MTREIVEAFAALEGHVCARAPRDVLRALHDPHDDADRWLEATPEEREAMAPSFAERLRAAAAENARALVRPKRRSRNAYMRELRRRPDLREKNREYCRAWRARMTEEQREKNRAACRAWRQAKKAA